MDKLRIGLIGASRVATYAVIAPARDEPRAEVAAVAARDPRRAEAYAAEHGVPRAHASYEALIADPGIDVVYVATPPRFHREAALAAIAAGKPVLVEKPFAMTAAEAIEMTDAAARAGVPIFEAMHSRFHPFFARLRAAAAEVGPIRRIDARFEIGVRRGDGEFRWRDDLGGGALMDLGVYPLAWCRGLTGEEPEVVSARARLVDGVDVRTLAELRFASGVRATIAAAMDVDERTAAVEVVGARGRVIATNPLAPQLGNRLVVESDAGRREESVGGPSTYAAQLAALCAALIDGAPWPLPPGDPVGSMAALDAVRAASRAAN